MAVSTNPPPRGSCGLTPTHPIAPKLGGSPHRPPHSASPWPHSGVQPHWGAQGEHPHGDTAVPECHQAGAPVTHREGTASHGWHRGRDGTPSSPRPVPNPVVPLPTPPPPPPERHPHSAPDSGCPSASRHPFSCGSGVCGSKSSSKKSRELLLGSPRMVNLWDTLVHCSRLLATRSYSSEALGKRSCSNLGGRRGAYGTVEPSTPTLDKHWRGCNTARSHGVQRGR